MTVTSDHGVECPKCGQTNTGVSDSRATMVLGKQGKRRRRKCLACGAVFSSYEFSFDEGGRLRCSPKPLEDWLDRVPDIPGWAEISTDDRDTVRRMVLGLAQGQKAAP